MNRASWLGGLSGAALVAAVSCSEPSEPARVQLPVLVDPAGAKAVTTNLGYEIELIQARLVVEDLAFTVAGEVHTASLPETLRSLVVSTAFAHPGHYQGGDVTGELRGRFFLDLRAPDAAVERGGALFAGECARCHGDFAQGGTGPSIGGYPAIAEVVKEGRGDMPAFDLSDGELADLQAFLGTRLGVATLLVGRYESVNFTFGAATAADGLGDDVLVGHTAVLAGTATKDGQTWSFVDLIDSPADRALVGAPFSVALEEGATGTLGFRLDLTDPVQGDTLFDDVDFAALDGDGDGHVQIVAGVAEVEPAYNFIRRAFQTHDHYSVQHRE